jgi:transcriptional regulator with XRE-family HTH domain
MHDRQVERCPRCEAGVSESLSVDVKSLHRALDAAREQKELSWRQLAKEIGVSASTISRMANGLKPDVTAFAAMTTWLQMPAEDFYVGTEDSSNEEPDLVAQLVPLLRARKDLKASDVAYLEEVLGAAARRFRAESESRG